MTLPLKPVTDCLPVTFQATLPLGTPGHAFCYRLFSAIRKKWRNSSYTIEKPFWRRMQISRGGMRLFGPKVIHRCSKTGWYSKTERILIGRLF